LCLGVKVNLKVDRRALPEGSLEVEVEVGCTLYWYCSLYVNWYTLLLLGVKVNLKVDRKAFPEVSLEVEVGCTLPFCLDSEGSVLRVKVQVM
jgi:hypothetical protein